LATSEKATTWPMKAGQAKKKTVSELADKLQRSKMAVVTDYRGMQMPEISNLRGQLRKIDTEYHVVKNTLVGIAGHQVGIDALKPVLSGTTAIAFVFGDIAAPAKLLADVARTSKFLKIKAAMLQGRLVGGDQLMVIVNLPPRPVLQAQFLGALQGPSASVVGMVGSPLQGFLAVLQARATKLEAS
jgi:large subunit ribosomal protein L10